MDASVVGNIVAILAAILSGGLTAWASIYLYRRQDVSLEGDEIRRRKIDIVSQILGMKYILVEGYNPHPNEVMAFNSALSLLPLFFFDSKDVMRSYDSYLIDCKNTDKLVAMLRVAAKELGFDVPDSILTKNVSITASRLPFELVMPPSSN